MIIKQFCPVILCIIFASDISGEKLVGQNISNSMKTSYVGQTQKKNSLTELNLNLDQNLYGDTSLEEMKSYITSLYKARRRTERTLARDPVAKLAEDISQVTRDCTCIHMRHDTDVLYDNRTDFMRELKFTSNVYNCGKAFDITRLLNLVKKYSKLKPYTIGNEGDDIPEAMFNTTTEGTTKCVNGSSNSAFRHIDAPKHMINPSGKEKGPSWWMANQQKNYGIDSKGKPAVKLLYNVTTVQPVPNEMAATKAAVNPQNIKKLINPQTITATPNAAGGIAGAVPNVINIQKLQRLLKGNNATSKTVTSGGINSGSNLNETQSKLRKPGNITTNEVESRIKSGPSLSKLQTSNLHSVAADSAQVVAAPKPAGTTAAAPAASHDADAKTRPLHQHRPNLGGNKKEEKKMKLI